MLLLNGNWKLQVIVVIEIKLIIGWFWLRHVMKFNQKNSHTASWTRRRRRDVNRREQGRQEDWRIERRAHRLSWWATVSAAVIDAAVLHNKTKHLCAATGNQSHYGWPLHGHGPKLGLRGLAWQQRLRLRQHLRDDWCLMPANTAAACCVGPVQQPHGRERHWHQQLVWALGTPLRLCGFHMTGMDHAVHLERPSEKAPPVQVPPDVLRAHRSCYRTACTGGKRRAYLVRQWAAAKLLQCLALTDVKVNFRSAARILSSYLSQTWDLAFPGESETKGPERAEGGSDSHVTRAGHMVRSRRTRKPSHRAQWPAFRSRSLNAFTEGKGIPWGEEDEGGNWERERVEESHVAVWHIT